MTLLKGDWEKRVSLLLLFAIILGFCNLPISVYAADNTQNDKNDSGNGYVSEIAFSNNGDFTNPILVDLDFDPLQKDYEIAVTSRSLSITPYLRIIPKEVSDNLWYRFYVDGTKVTFVALKDNTISRSPFDMSLMLLFHPALSIWPADGQAHTLTIEVGAKSDTDGNGTVDAQDDFSSSDSYNFLIKDAPAFSAFSVKDEAGEMLALTPPFQFGANHQSFVVFSTENTISLTASFSSNTTLYIGNKAFSEALTNENIELAAFESNTFGMTEIPLRLVSGSGVESIYMLNVSSVDYTPIITQQPQSITCDKGENVELSVIAEAPEGSSLTYQWMETATPIEGATEKTFRPDTSRAYSANYYCIVSNTVAGTTYTAQSQVATVNVNLSYVNTPVFVHQPGVDTWTRTPVAGWTGNGYKTTYYENSSFDDMFFGYERTEIGVSSSFVFYINDEPTYEGAQVLEGTINSRASGDENVYSFKSDRLFEQGTYYVGCVVTLTSDADSNLSASTASEFVELHFVEAPLDFAGTGTQDDPYQLATTEDMAKLSAYSLGGNKFGNRYFKLIDDVTLPDDWTPLGDNWENHFEGIINGDGHTLTVPVGGLPLLGYVLNAQVSDLNIYGEQIAGYGLVNNYGITGQSGTAITIDNVTLKSGTQTLKAGLVGADMGANPYAGTSAGYKVVISNCTAESGVIIGYSGDQDKIGTFAGRIQGNITNCTSAATVKGRHYVGGILGNNDQAMSQVTVSGCTFSGTVQASGEHAGGIVGGGYDNSSAPNGIKTSILNCSVSGSVSGADKVGGILGGDSFGFQAWNDHEITGNTFTGTVSGTGNAVGSIIGYYANLNKHDRIENNTCADGKVFGFVLSVDTSFSKYADDDTRPYGIDQTTGTYYYNSAVDDLKTIDRELVYPLGVDQSFGYVAQSNHNRTDDPLGDGTEVTVKSLAISGEYKTEYAVGDEALDTTGMTITATMSDGTTQDVAIADAEFSGFDSSKPGQNTITVAYGGATATFTVTVKAPEGETINVKLSILGDTLHEGEDIVHTLSAGNLTTWVAETTYTVDANATVWNLLLKAFEENGITFTYRMERETEYIDSVTYNGVTLKEKDNNPNSGWQYTINGQDSTNGVNQQFLAEGDVICFHWTDDYTQEDYSGQFDDQQAAFAVEDLIFAIPAEITLADEDAIVAARTAYDALTDTQKALVDADALAALEAAEAALAALKESAAKVADVIEKINAIPEEITLESETVIAAARAAFDALTEAEQAQVTNADKLTAAETRLAELKQQQADQAAADAVIAKIAAIGEVTLESETAINEARAAYDALTAAQKALVSNYETLTAAETRLAELKEQQGSEERIAEATTKIDAIPEEITLESEEAIVAARAAYDALTDEEKAQVNVDKLIAAEQKLAELKEQQASAERIAEANTRIDAIPEEITLESEEAIVAARAAYDALTDEEKAQITNYDKLVEAEKKLAELKFAEAKTTVKAVNLKNGTIKLTWTAIEGAKQYKVLVATSKTGTYKLAGTVTGKTFTYKKGTVGKACYFKVVGVNAEGTESAESKIVSKYRLPGQVGSLKVKSEKAKQVTLTWKKVTGAKKYFVYMSKNGKTGWKKVGTATKTTFTYKKGTSGKTLYFKVQAVSSSGKKGEFSAVKKCKVK